ncbi:MAG: T9SS type A sorting domain-containing protein, partial [Bacteroidales bacterium]|nr:T9SS type A sorting domain-containing protein [Bacteroidales bacterium]
NPLPVSLISFDAKKQDDVAVINWQTASEINNDYFIVQRSTNGIDVDDIGRIEGNGNSNILLSYSFIDDMPPFGNVYYRLKQVDYDGKSEIFFWKSLFFGHDIEISIYPNPNTNNVIYFESSNNSEAQIQIYSIGGKLMMEKNLTFASGKAALMHDLAKGYYLIKYFQNNEQIVQKLIIQ